MNVSNTIKKILSTFGYDIQIRKLNSGRVRSTIGESYALLKDLGFIPRTVIDVGVASGTPELYSAFPDSYFLLIEPLETFEADLIAILNRYKGSYVLAAAGPGTGQATFNVHQYHLSGSSLHKESMGTEADGHEITVPTVRIDDVIKDKRLAGPYLIKVDVQGAELAALDGARQTLLEAEAVALEVSLFEFMKGAPQFYEVISYMKDRGFVAYDIILGWNRPLDNALGQVDIVFVKENGIFRQEHSYSTIDQIKTLNKL